MSKEFKVFCSLYFLMIFILLISLIRLDLNQEVILVKISNIFSIILFANIFLYLLLQKSYNLSKLIFERRTIYIFFKITTLLILLLSLILFWIYLNNFNRLDFDSSKTLLFGIGSILFTTILLYRLIKK